MASITLRAGGDAQNDKVGIDWWLVGSALILIAVGLAAIGSAVANAAVKGNPFADQLKKILMGIVPVAIFGFCHPKIWSRYANWIYVANLLALIATLAVGSTKKGAERWLAIGPIEIQPSEFSKIFIVITLAAFFANRQDRMKEFSTYALSLLHVLVPALLIYRQPHLGATILVIVIWVALSLVAGVPPKFMLSTLIPMIIIGGLVFFVTPIRNQVLKPYQAKRVEGLLGIKSSNNLKTTKDSKEADRELADKKRQTRNAELAFGNGGLSGTGYRRGEQKSKVMEQHSDFIFSLIGEEFGFLGTMSVLGVFGVFFYRIWVGMLNAADFISQMLMGGILTIFSFHLIVNLGMVLGMLPVVGMWSPFLSYGGTAMWLCMSMVALAVNIRSKERAVLF
jgi:rod shape determining protein RodA